MLPILSIVVLGFMPDGGDLPDPAAGIGTPPHAIVHPARVVPPALPCPPGTPGPPCRAVSDTFGDLHVEALVRRARAARGVAAEGLESFEGRMWERVYVGFDGPTFRRERGLYQRETSARIRWTADGDHVVHWEAGRMAVPIVGRSSEGDEEVAEELAGQLLRGQLPPPLTFDPASDRLLFGAGNWALDPLADTAGLHYRFESGDTLRITLPEDGRQVTLAEVRVIPRRSEFRLLSASLWFDEGTGALVRGLYRPSRPFDLRLDTTEDYPRFLPSIQAEIRLVSVDYSLQEMQWWIPHRFAFDGEMRAGRFARVPVTFEWSVTEVFANDPAAPDLVPDSLPEGWRIRTDSLPAREGRPTRHLTVVVPPAEQLRSGPGLRGAGFGDPVAIDEGELRAFERRIRAMAPPARSGPQVQWGLAEGLTRYNRIEGLATGIAVRQPLPPGLGPGGGEVGATVRSGTAARIPTGELFLRTGRAGRSFQVGGYRRLVPSGGFDSPHSLSSSVAALVRGGGPTPFHRAMGAEAVWTQEDRSRQVRLRLFGEWQEAAHKGTDAHLWRVFSSDRHLPGVVSARSGGWGGVQTEYRWQSGVDPLGPLLFTRIEGEAGSGETTYGRGQLLVGATLPISSSWAAAIEGIAGGSLGDLPPQRHFAPGGPGGYRGGRVGERMAEGFTLARAEVGRGVPGARVVVFGDLLHTFGPLDGPSPPLVRHRRGGEVAAGAGFSFLDGLARMEFARPVSTSGSWRALFYLDGLF